MSVDLDTHPRPASPADEPHRRDPAQVRTGLRARRSRKPGPRVVRSRRREQPGEQPVRQAPVTSPTTDEAPSQVPSSPAPQVDAGPSGTEMLMQSLAHALQPIRRMLAPVTAIGWSVVAAAIGLIIIGAVLQWREFTLAGTALLILFIACAALIFGRDHLSASITLNPERVSVGDEARSVFTVTNSGSVRSARLDVELPVGASTATFTVPSLAPGAEHRESLLIPTSRRSVVTLGPPTIVRGDPFGLWRRIIEISDKAELFVHPRLVAVPSLNAGIVRDLEGQSTQDPSVADLDFHMLRGYVPGDDLRHVHWKSSARSSSATGAMDLLVKQYVDTRRSHVAVIVDGELGGYVDEDDFEDAIVSAASLAARALRDEIDLTVAAATEVMDRRSHSATLDGFARMTPCDTSLAELVTHVVELAPNTSVAILITGSEHSFGDVRRASVHLPPMARVIIIRTRPGARSSMNSVHGLTVLTMGHPSELPRLVEAAGL